MDLHSQENDSYDLLSTNWSTDVASERLGAGKTELLEEGDLGGGCYVGVVLACFLLRSR